MAFDRKTQIYPQRVTQILTTLLFVVALSMAAAAREGGLGGGVIFLAAAASLMLFGVAAVTMRLRAMAVARARTAGQNRDFVTRSQVFRGRV